MPKKKSGPTKTDFVRSLPPDLSIADVVAKAKEAGISISPNYVANIRSVARKGSAKPKKSAPAKAAHTTAVEEKLSAPTKPAGEKLSASGFIRSMPLTMPVKEVAEKGAAAGYSFPPAYVYGIRNADKKRKAKAAKVSRSTSKPKDAAAKPSAAPTYVAAHARHASSQSAQLRKLMIDLGLAQAEALCAEVLSELKAFRNKE